MKPPIVVALAASISLLCYAQEKPTTAPPPQDALIEHLLDWPVMGTAFHQALLRHWDEGNWSLLDTRWKSAQSAEPRYALLRGLLAERQGNLKIAAERYAEAGTTEWARYHRGRLMALLGDINGAKTELMEVATGTKRPWLFKECATALAEITHLQGGTDAAENLYHDFWRDQPDIRMRVSILEPLLSLCAKRNQGNAWVDTLKVAQAAAAPDSAESAELAALQRMARSLLAPDPRPNMLPMRSMTLVAALNLPLGAGDLATQVENAKRYAAESPPDDDRLISILRSGRGKFGDDGFRQIVRAMKPRLRANPDLLASLFSQTDGREADTLKFIEAEIMEGLDSPAWSALSLWLRAKAGSPPDSLRQDAEKLWRRVTLESWTPRFASEPEGSSHIFMTQYTFRRPASSDTPPVLQVPSPSVIWNVRGQVFVDAAAARMKQGMHSALEKEAFAAVGYQPDLVGQPVERIPESFYNSAPRFATGEEIRAWLWEGRKHLGLSGEVWAGQAVSSADKALEMLLLGSPEDVVRFASDDEKIKSLHSRWLCLLLHRLSGLTGPHAASASAAQFRLADRLLQRHPDWLSLALQQGVSLSKVPAQDHAGKVELLAAIGAKWNSRLNAERVSHALAIWQALDPGLSSMEKVELASLQATRTLALHLLPHPLWDLEWQPSLLRDIRIAPGRHRMMNSGPHDALVNDSSPNARFKKSAGSLSGILFEAYNSRLIQPLPERREELRPYVARHPVVGDYISAWEAIAKLEASESQGMSQPGIPTPAVLAAAFESLRESKTPTARYVVARMLHIMVDEGTGKLAGELQKVEGAVGIWASQFLTYGGSQGSKPGGIQPNTTQRPPPDPAAALQVLLADPALAAEWKRGRLGDIYYRISRHRATPLDVYELLRKEVKPEPAFALKARLMLLLARSEVRPAQEINAAELIDLRLNPDSPEALLARAVRYANAKNELAAVDFFFEALRRIDLENPPEFSGGFEPQSGSWVQRVRNSGRIDELTQALMEALERTAPDKAGPLAADFALLVFQKQDPSVRRSQPDSSGPKPDSWETGGVTFKRSESATRMPPAAPVPPGIALSPERMERVLKAIRERQQHLLAMRFNQWLETAVNLDEDGAAESATQLSRALLLSWWPKSLAHIKGNTGSYVYQSQMERLGSWGSSISQIRHDAKIKALFPLALRGNAADFLKQCEKAASDHPDDEQLVSVALLAMALQGPLPDQELERARKLPPDQGMRVAWRLCELAPPAHIKLASLAPLLCDGIKAYVEAPAGSYGGNHYIEMLSLFTWVEKSATEAQIASLIPSLCRGLESVKMEQWPEVWQPLVALARNCKDPAPFNAVRDALLKRYPSDSDHGGLPNDLKDHIAHGLSRMVLDSEGYDTAPIAGRAFDLWRQGWKRHQALTSIAAATNAVLGEALLVTDLALFDSFDAITDEMIAIAREPNLASVQERLRSLRRLMEDPDAVTPMVSLWVETPTAGDGAAPRLHWQMNLPQLTRHPENGSELPDSADSGLIRIELGTSSALFRKFSGRYDLEVVAGPSAEQFQTVAEVSAAADRGAVEAKDLPSSGWMRGLLRHTKTGSTILGRSIPYSAKEKVIDTTQSAGVASWPNEVAITHGVPVSPLVQVVKGAEYVVTVAPHEAATGENRLRLICLNKDKKPIREFTLPERKSGRFASLFNPFEGLSDGQRQRRDPPMKDRSIENASGLVPHYFVLTSMLGRSRDLPEVQVRVFSTPPASLASPPMLKIEQLAKLGFDATSWYISETMPRAAFTGPGQMVAFDTSIVPWRMLGRFESKELTGLEWPVFFKPGEICLYQPVPVENLRSGYRVVQLEPGISIEASPRTELPFTPTMSDLSPSENALIFAATSHAPGAMKTQVGRLDAGMEVKTVSFERPYVYSHERTLPPISAAWWGKEGGFTLAQGGMLHQIQHDASGLRHVKADEGTARLETVPPGAIPARGLLHRRWILKKPNELVRRDPQTGALLSTFRLPVDCVFSPVWYDDNARGVLLLTSGFDLVRVLPPPLPPEAGKEVAH